MDSLDEVAFRWSVRCDVAKAFGLNPWKVGAPEQLEAVVAGRDSEACARLNAVLTASRERQAAREAGASDEALARYDEGVRTAVFLLQQHFGDGSELLPNREGRG
jgi:hypothetical protein